ncbi:hypothetical protein [Chryseobacterium hagamense]|uniref:C1q domain-containing protein n=1 Tax=Chryseobacterium hagamense TaxID=395935 RepID=A0A511YR43_9FLAO|nr:hypothetical protein [Chryseobacterium hagamense]GEN77652.1 hypothetical protein CHA01nite_33920 [Chryseobacterium hagamense]
MKKNLFILSTVTCSVLAYSQVGIGNTTPNAKLDIRTNTTSVTDPGEGMLGIGTSASSASSAGAGALRYSTSAGGSMQYSNGANWNTLSSNVQKSIVVARKTSSQSIGNTTVTNIIDWSETSDSNNNFDPVTGIFTAPRDGNYTVSFNFIFNSAGVSADSQVEAQLYLSSGPIKIGINGYATAGTVISSSSVNVTVRMAAGETLRPAIYHNTGSSKSTRAANGFNDYVNFSVAEL